MPSSISLLYSFYLLRQGISLNLWLTVLTRLTSETLKSAWSLTEIHHCTQLYVGSGDLNLGPNVCVASALLDESSPQSPSSLLRTKYISSTVEGKTRYQRNA